MRIFVTGANGQLGYDIVRELNYHRQDVFGSDIAENHCGLCSLEELRDRYVQLDITDQSAVDHTISMIKPDVIIHCAAWTDVDGAENKENYSLIHSINAVGTENIAQVAKRINAKMVYFSTDYVFDGTGSEPWKPDDKDFKPLNVYGETKREGEIAVESILEMYFIIRIAWVFGLNGKNFVKTMLKVGRDRDSVDVVNDQIGTPTFTEDLARLVAEMIDTDKYGFYHATNSETTEGGYISWADFAEKVFQTAGYNTIVNRVSTEEYGLAKAKRPLNSRLDKTKLYENGFEILPTWDNAVERFISKLYKEDNHYGANHSGL